MVPGGGGGGGGGGAAVPPRGTTRPTEGTPEPSRTKSSQYPGGAFSGLSGPTAVTPVEEVVNVSRLKRWLWLKECVTEASRIIVTCAMRAASGVAMSKLCPYEMLAGTELIA